MDPRAEELVARLQRDPNDHDAYLSLAAHYRERGDHASLINLLEGWAGQSQDPQRAGEAFCEAGDLALRFLRDAHRADTLFTRALQCVPAMDAAFEGRWHLAEGTDPQHRLELLHHRSAALQAQGGSSGRQIADVEFRQGELQHREFRRPDVALGHYRRAFEADPTHVASLYAARELYQGAGNTRAAASLMALEAKAETDPQRQLALWRELAQLQQHELGDDAGACQSLREALRVAPDDLSLKHELSGVLLRRAGHREDPAKARSDREKAAQLLFEMAQAVPGDHALAYCEAALDAAPGHHDALSLLEQEAERRQRLDLLPLRWVGFLHEVSEGPEAQRRRRSLGFAYLQAGQDNDALVCLLPLLADGDAEAAKALVPLLEAQGRIEEANEARSIALAALPAAQRSEELRRLIRNLRDAGDTDGALARARELLSVDPGDHQTLGFVEAELRKRGDHPGLRDVLFSAARAPELALEQRVRRLRDAAELSEHALEDSEGAIDAWRALLVLAPQDDEAKGAVRRLLSAAERWDDLTAQLQGEAQSEADPETRSHLLLEIAGIHRDRRNDPEAAVEALQTVRGLNPEGSLGRDALCDLLLRLGRYEQGLPLLEERIAEEEDATRKVQLLDWLADLHERQGQGELAFANATRILDIDPAHLGALDRMARLDETYPNPKRLLETLSYRAEVVTPDERPELLRRMGDLAEHQLQDLPRAADYLRQALDQDPGDTATLDALCRLYETTERFRDLIVLLRDRAEGDENPATRADLYRRIARTLRDHVQNPDAAAEAWERVLEQGEDLEALGALRAHAGEHGDLSGMIAFNARLAAATADRSDARAYLLENTEFEHQLGNISGAIRELRKLVDEGDDEGDDMGPALRRLAAYSEEAEDHDSLALALERLVFADTDLEQRRGIAQKLADLYEGPLPDANRAADALLLWVQAAPRDNAPRRRLLPLLEAQERWAEVVENLDALAALEGEEGEASLLRAASLAETHLGDPDGAWSRLAPRITTPAFEEALRALASRSDRHAALAECYVSVAQQAATDAQGQWWRRASEVFESELQQPKKALEASLRAFALDLLDAELQADVDRLAIAAQDWQRLQQVYDRLVKGAQTPDDKGEQLLRLARILRDEAKLDEAAFDRALRAASLLPQHEEPRALAEALAPGLGRSEDLLVLYERRKGAAGEDTARLAAILRMAEICAEHLGDADRASQYIAQGAALCMRTPELRQTFEEGTLALPAEDMALRLALIYRAIARDAKSEQAAQLLVWSARLYDEVLGKAEQAWPLLAEASSLHSGEQVLDALEVLGRRRDPQALDAHLTQLVGEAFDSTVATGLLWRQGALREELKDPAAAAQVYGRLRSMTKEDRAVDAELRCLREAGAHQDLLIALGRETKKASDPNRKAQLLVEAALTWERDLQNAYEAVDLAKRALRAAPNAEAEALLARLGNPATSSPGSLRAPAAAPESLVAPTPEGAEPAALEAEALAPIEPLASNDTGDVIDAADALEVVEDFAPSDTGEVIDPADALEVVEDFAPSDTGEVIDAGGLEIIEDFAPADTGEVIESFAGLEVSEEPPSAIEVDSGFALQDTPAAPSPGDHAFVTADTPNASGAPSTPAKSRPPLPNADYLDDVTSAEYERSLEEMFPSVKPASPEAEAPARSGKRKDSAEELDEEALLDADALTGPGMLFDPVEIGAEYVDEASGDVPPMDFDEHDFDAVDTAGEVSVEDAAAALNPTNELSLEELNAPSEPPPLPPSPMAAGSSPVAQPVAFQELHPGSTGELDIEELEAADDLVEAPVPNEAPAFSVPAGFPDPELLGTGEIELLDDGFEAIDSAEIVAEDNFEDLGSAEFELQPLDSGEIEMLPENGNTPPPPPIPGVSKPPPPPKK